LAGTTPFPCVSDGSCRDEQDPATAGHVSLALGHRRRLIAGSYLAWLIIPLVVSSGLSPNVKTALTAVLGVTPLATKFIAVALLGRPTINYLKKHPLRLFRGKSGPAD
jgi:hypothetical protein